MSNFSFFINLIPRPVRATRVRGGGLEPSANFHDKLDRWRHLRNRWELLGTRLRFFLWTFLLEPANLKIRGSRGGIFNDFFEAISLLLMLDFKSPRLNSTETLLRICFIKAGLLQWFTYWTSKIPNRQSSVSTKYCGSHYNFYLLIWSYNSRSS